MIDLFKSFLVRYIQISKYGLNIKTIVKLQFLKNQPLFERMHSTETKESSFVTNV